MNTMMERSHRAVAPEIERTPSEIAKRGVRSPGGRPAPHTGERLAARFGHDFSRVRVQPRCESLVARKRPDDEESRAIVPRLEGLVREAAEGTRQLAHGARDFAGDYARGTYDQYASALHMMGSTLSLGGSVAATAAETALRPAAAFGRRMGGSAERAAGRVLDYAREAVSPVATRAADQAGSAADRSVDWMRGQTRQIGSEVADWLRE